MGVDEFMVEAPDAHTPRPPAWVAPPRPPDEVQRQWALDDLCVLDTEADEAIDALTRLVRDQLAVNTVLVSLVDRERCWLQSTAGASFGIETPRETSFCGWAILKPRIMVVNDTHLDPRFANHPVVLDGPRLRFYAGAPLLVNGHAVGTLCALHDQPRELSPAEHDLMQSAALIAVRLLRERLLEDEGMAMGRLLEAAIEEAYVFDLRQQRIVYASRGAAQRLGMDLDALRRLQPRALCAQYEWSTVTSAFAARARTQRHPVRRITWEIEHQRAQGDRYPVSAQLTPVSAQVVGHPAQGQAAVPASDEALYVVVASNAQERRALERELAYRAHHDALTGLANRYLLEDHFDSVCQRADRGARLVGVAAIDLDGFKRVNDDRGHAAGDEVLQHVARTLLAAVRRHDTVARVGGDEFVVLFDGIEDHAELRAIYDRVWQALAQAPCDALGGVPVAFSAGLAVSDAAQADLDAMMVQADAAMYQDKRS